MLTYPTIDPVIFNIYGPISLNWYGLSYAVGICLCSYFATRSLFKYFNIKIKYDDLMSYAIIGIILGGRLFYIIFYDPAYYLQNIGKTIAIWEGGMSFHGGVVGLFLAMVFFAKSFKVDLSKICDVLVIYIPLGILFGRIANFINGELFGRVSYCALCMIFPTDSLQLPRHPSQLYEAFTEGLVLLIIMLLLNKHFETYKKSWLNSGLFFVLYSFFRFIIENFRQPDEQIGLFFRLLTMGQLLCIIQFALGCYLIFRSYNSYDSGKVR